MARHLAPTALRDAIFRSGQRQIVVAKKAGIHESRLSKIANGHIEASTDEKRALARVLRCSIADLFPSEQAVAS